MEELSIVAMSSNASRARDHTRLVRIRLRHCAGRVNCLIDIISEIQRLRHVTQLGIEIDERQLAALTAQQRMKIGKFAWHVVRNQANVRKVEIKIPLSALAHQDDKFIDQDLQSFRIEIAISQTNNDAVSDIGYFPGVSAEMQRHGELL
jgi:hypothetical protein